MVATWSDAREERGIPGFVGKKKEGKGRHNFESAASIALMSLSPEPPERLAEILLEILAMSKPTWTNQSESVCGDDRTESFDADYVKEQAQRRDEEDINRQRP